MEALLSLENVFFSYPGSGTVLFDVSLDVPQGDCVALLGPNGSGKSTLIRMMNGLLRPCTGTVRLRGREVSEYPRRLLAREMAVVHQAESPVYPFTVKETVAMGRWAHGGGLGWLSREDRLAVDKAMRLAGVSALGSRHLADLSGGERQRVLLARALAQEAAVCLLDEPVAHLDLEHQMGILELLAEINRVDGRTVLMAIHDLELAARFCRRVVVLEGGSVAEDGPPDRVIGPRLLREVFGVDALVDRNPVTGTPRVTVIGIQPREDSGHGPVSAGDTRKEEE